MSNREQGIARRTITRLKSGDTRLEPALRVNGQEYSAVSLSALNIAELWGDGMARYVDSFLTCIRRNRHKTGARWVYVYRDCDEEVYPDDLCILEAAGWQVAEMIVTYESDTPTINHQIYRTDDNE